MCITVDILEIVRTVAELRFVQTVKGVPSALIAPIVLCAITVRTVVIVATQNLASIAMAVTNCFECVYLADKEYYILNEPYSPEEYHKKVAEIKQELLDNKIYNMTLYFVTDYEKRRLAEEDDSIIQSKLDTTNFPPKYMSKTILQCQIEDCGKDFLVVPQEQEFYERKDIAMPIFCPAHRHAHRMALRNERKLYNRKCDKCQSSILSTYPEDVEYTIYCQKCFWENIA